MVPRPSAGESCVCRYAPHGLSPTDRALCSYYTRLAMNLPDSAVILTLGCGKFRVIGKKDYGNIPGTGIPRVLDLGQCNDSYSAVVVASALAQAFGTDVNGLPLSIVLSWFEQVRDTSSIFAGRPDPLRALTCRKLSQSSCRFYHWVSRTSASAPRCRPSSLPPRSSSFRCGLGVSALYCCGVSLSSIAGQIWAYGDQGRLRGWRCRSSHERRRVSRAAVSFE